MNKIIRFCGLLVSLLLVFTASSYAQSYKMLAPSSDAQMFYGLTTLSSGSKTVSVLTDGTVTAAVSTLNSVFTTGTATPRLAVTKSGGSITIQAYDDAGTNTTSAANVFYVGAGTQ